MTRSSATTVPSRSNSANGAAPRPSTGGPAPAPAKPRLEAAKTPLSRKANAIIDEVAKVVVGKHHVLELVTINMLAGGHILFEDLPGLGKTVLSNTFAQATGLDFGRVQFTPDVLPGDITGSSIFEQHTGQFKFRPGPVFTNILLADEINRAPPKTQSALLEAMAERQVSLEGKTHKLPTPFLVMATQNPVDQEGTYPLPEAQMDRFLMKLSMGHPNRSEEAEILVRRIARGKDDADVRRVTSAEEVVVMQRLVEKVHVHRDLIDYISDIICRTREHDAVQVGSSPRGSIALLKAARAHATLQGRAFVIPDDVKSMAGPVLAHRLILMPEARIRGATDHQVVKDVLAMAQVPSL